MGLQGLGGGLCVGATCPSLLDRAVFLSILHLWLDSHRSRSAALFSNSTLSTLWFAPLPPLGYRFPCSSDVTAAGLSGRVVRRHRALVLIEPCPCTFIMT